MLLDFYLDQSAHFACFILFVPRNSRWGDSTEKYLILNGMHWGDSANIRRLNGIHNTLPVASGRLRIGWNAASWPRPNPLFHSFRIHPLYTTVCSLPPQNHSECTLCAAASATPTIVIDNKACFVFPSGFAANELRKLTGTHVFTQNLKVNVLRKVLLAFMTSEKDRSNL